MKMVHAELAFTYFLTDCHMPVSSGLSVFAIKGKAVKIGVYMRCSHRISKNVHTSIYIASWSSGQLSCFVLGRSQVHILARRLAIILPQSLQANSRILP